MLSEHYSLTNIHIFNFQILTGMSDLINRIIESENFIGMFIPFPHDDTVKELEETFHLNYLSRHTGNTAPKYVHSLCALSNKQ